MNILPNIAKLISRDMCSFPVHMNERHPKGSRDQQ